MCHIYRQHVENPDLLSGTSPHRVIPTWPGLQLLHTAPGHHKLRGLPATDPEALEATTSHGDIDDWIDL